MLMIEEILCKQILQHKPTGRREADKPRGRLENLLP
jgi:hypothetical protein